MSYKTWQIDKNKTQIHMTQRSSFLLDFQQATVAHSQVEPGNALQ